MNKSPVDRTFQIVRAQVKRTIQNWTGSGPEPRRTPSKTVPVAVGLLSLVIGIGAIVVAGTQLPKLRPPPEVIIVKVKAKPPEVETKPVNTSEPKRIASVESEPTPAPESQAAPVASSDPSRAEPEAVAKVEPPHDEMAVRRLPQAQSTEPQPQPESTVKVDPSAFERIQARPPLSEFYTPEAQKTPEPKPKPEEQWRLTRMFYPVASAAGRIEVKGHKVVLAGLEPLGVGERCTWNGVDWPCGTVGRTAFRQWLRARAVQCKVPLTPKPEEITSECQVGKTDIGEWLVSRGWAHAVAGGPYVEYEKWAKTSRIGVYGPPPRRPAGRINPQTVNGSGPEIINLDMPESTPDELNQNPQPGGLFPQIEP